MNKAIGLLALAMVSTSVNAIQLDFSGELSHGTGAVAVGDTFSASFNFDLDNPNDTEVDGTVLATLGYGVNASASLTSGGNQFNSNYIELIYANDFNLTQDEINSHGYNSLVAPGVYDLLLMVGQTDDAAFDEFDDNLIVEGVEFTALAVFAGDMFESTGFSYDFFLESDPLFLGMEAKGASNGAAIFHGAGAADVSAVPVPAAFWMFGSALAGLMVRSRKSS